MIPRKKSRPSHKKISLSGKLIPAGKGLTVALHASPFYRQFLNTYGKAGDEITLTIELKRPKRSILQNNFYHVYLDLIGLSTGHTVDELKAWVRETILAKGVKEVFGTIVRIVKSSADQNMGEFCEMMNSIEEKTGIPIPDPAPFSLALMKDEHGKLKVEQENKYRKLKPMSSFVRSKSLAENYIK